MHDLIDIAVANAVVAGGLALVAWVAARYVRRPALTHALCLLVLLKLVTPPLFDVRLRLPWEQPASLPLVDMAAAANLAAAFDIVDWNRVIQISLIIWMVGSVCWFALQFRLAMGLRAAVQCATPAPASATEAVARLAGEMGLRGHPPLRVLSAADSPMLCGFGPGVCIVVPAAMFERLSLAAQQTILAHELAHFARRDHWVRLVEVIVTGCFWWHPVVWWARRQIESAEEQCCDAMVMRYCAGQKRAYAEAILDVVDWLAERRRTASPALASALGGRAPLTERLRGLLEGDRPPQAYRGGGAGVAIAAALCLFVQPRVEVLAPAGMHPATALAGEDRLETATEVAPHHVERAQIWATAVSPGGQYVISVRPGYRCELTELATSRVRDFDEWQITCLAFAPNGASLVIGDLDGWVRHIDVASGRELSVLTSGATRVRSLDVSAQGDRVATADDQGKITIIALASKEEVSWTCQAPVRCIRFSPDGGQLAIALGSWRDLSQGGVEIVDLASRQIVQRWDSQQPLGALRYVSPDGLLTADWAGRVECRRISDGRVLDATDAPKELVSAEAFSPHAQALATLARQFTGVVRRDSQW